MSRDFDRDVDRILRFLDGRCSFEESTKFQQELADDEKLRQLYVDLCVQQTALAEIDCAKDADRKSRHSVSSPAPFPHSRFPFSHWSWPAQLLSVVAAGLLLIVTAYYNIHNIREWNIREWNLQGGGSIANSSSPANHSNSPANEEQSFVASSARRSTTDGDVVAHITRTIDCLLTNQSWGINDSDTVCAGTSIQLQRGFLELQFLNGVTTVLQGPASIDLVSDMHCRLNAGSLSARVPDGCEGFVVETPSAVATDLGTEFGISVDDAGGTNLVVSEGLVAVQQKGEVELGDEQLIDAQSGWQSETNAKYDIPEDCAHLYLPSSYMDEPSVDATPALPIHEGLALWLAADRGVRVDVEGKVVCWSDISRSGLDRKSAWQTNAKRRPTLVEDGIGGRPSLRFAGREFLVTEPLRTTDDQTLFIVGRMVERQSGNRGIQFLNYNGPPHIVLEYRPGQEKLIGRVFGGYRTSVQQQGGKPIAKKAGRLLADFENRNQPFVLSYQYGYSTNTSAIFLNGEVQQRGDATLPAAGGNSKFVGCHRRSNERFLAGLISEILIFNRKLPEGEMMLVNNYLLQRHGLLAEERFDSPMTVGSERDANN